MPLVLVTDSTFDHLDVESAILGPLGCQIESRQCKTPDELIEAVPNADYIITQFAPVNAAVIGAMAKARVIVRYGIGVDNVDLDVARARGIPVCNVPDYCIDEVADHVARFRTDGRSDPLSLAGGVSRASSTRTLTVYAGMVDEWTFVGNSGTAVRRSPIRRGCPTARHFHAGAPCSTD
jgi:hypothetical protein